MRIGSTIIPLVATCLLGGLLSPAHAQWTTQQVSAPRLQYRTFQSAAAGTAVSFHVYTPPQYDQQPLRRFPVLYWLHGAGSASAGIAPMTNWFASAMAAGDLAPMIVVFPNGMPYGMYCDAADGSRPIETVIIDELIPHVDATLRTIPSRRGRILEGFSMGGFGTARFGAKHCELFAGISILAAGPMQTDFPNAPEGAPIPPAMREMIFQDVWNGDASLFLADSPWMLAEVHAASIRANDPLIRVAVGESDSGLEPNIAFHERLESLAVAHTFETFAGVGHNTLALLSAMGPANWNFYRDALNTRCDAIDFNNDGTSFDPQDIDALLSVFSEGPCIPATAACNDIDFNNDGALFDPCDIDSFLQRYSEGPCTLCGV